MLELDAEDALTCVAMRGRGLVAGGQKGVIYLYDPPDPAAKRCACVCVCHSSRLYRTNHLCAN